MAIEFDEFLDVLSNDHLLPENVWHKFLFDEQIQSMPIVDTAIDMKPRNVEVVKNDFMWSGNGTTNIKSVSLVPPGDVKPPVVQVEHTSQQSLLKPELRISVDPHTVVPMMTPSIHLSMQTPPISDDEETQPEPHQPTPILESLNWALLTNDLDDGELSDYFKDDGRDWGFFEDDIDEELLQEEEEEKKVTVKDVKPTAEELAKQRENEMRAFYAANDHSYHKGFSASQNFGLETPSDSEEEIDVVSLNDKFTTGAALPTNPTTRDRRQIQRTMQSRFPEGVKTAAPTRRAAEPKRTPEGKKTPERKAPETKGRGRQPKRAGRKSTELKSIDMMDKRDLHNNMERLRRIGLRNLFFNLAFAINPSDPNYKVAKVKVLQQAKDSIKKMTKERHRLRMQVVKVRERRNFLRLKLERLQREAARRRGH